MVEAQPIYSLRGKSVWVAGHAGMVGSALLRRLQLEGCSIITAPRDVLDLRRQQDVEEWMAAWKPEAVFLAAAKVGGIVANSSSPADFLEDNLTISTNVIHAEAKSGVEKLLYLGSPASIRNSPSNRSRKTNFSKAHLSPPTSGTPSPRSRG